MMLIPCPWCGERHESEFAAGGERIMKRPDDPGALDDDAWLERILVRANRRGRHIEMWWHVKGCGIWFAIERDTVTHEIVGAHEQGGRRRGPTLRRAHRERSQGGRMNLRLPAGGVIDRARTLPFTFNGREYSGLAGDTLASALLANGVHLVGRSFKYHRPRGIFGAGFEETGAIVQLVGDEDAPNVLATRLPLRAGLAARSVNCWPGPRFDLRAATQAASRLLVAGFYYKTFMWPTWHLFEPPIRRARGAWARAEDRRAARALRESLRTL